MPRFNGRYSNPLQNAENINLFLIKVFVKIIHAIHSYETPKVYVHLCKSLNKYQHNKLVYYPKFHRALKNTASVDIHCIRPNQRGHPRVYKCEFPKDGSKGEQGLSTDKATLYK